MTPESDPLRALDAAPYALFDRAEYRRRHAALDAIRADEDLDSVVVYGSGSFRHDIQFLTGWPPRHDAYLVATPAHDPVLFVQLFNHVPNAREIALMARVEWGGADSAEAVAGELSRRGARRVGVVGAVPYQAHNRIARGLPGGAFVDLTPSFRRMRLVKSEAEIEWTRRGAELCDEALRTLVQEARPGLREYELGAIVEGGYGRRGGQHGICFLATSPMGGGGRIVPAQNWSSRRLESGDAIVIELSAGIGGYTGQVLRTIAVGDVPAGYQRLHDVADEAFEAIFAAVRPGAEASDLVQAAAVIDRANLSVCDDVVHGYGGGYLPPILRTPKTAHAPTAEFALRSGMMLVIQPNVVDPVASAGVQTGELVVVGRESATSLHNLPRGLLHAASG